MSTLPDPLLIATGNPGKLREIVAILAARAPREMQSLRDHPSYSAPLESAADYLGNARLKAHDAARALGVPALADDSGIEVDALGGAPGVHSARFAGEDADAEANNRKLLRSLAGAERRGARYRCVIVLAWPDGREVSGEGACAGEVGFEPRGEGGFGYDPYFVLPGGRAMAEMSPAEKNRISHRARALEDLLRKLP